jgi:arylsulfatase A-like enzyme
VQISESQIGRAVRTARWKYAVVAPADAVDGQGGARRYREAMLFDLKADPWELVNLIEQGSHRAVADRMRERLLSRLAAAGEAAPEIETVAGRPSGQRRVSAAEVEA